MKVGYQHQCLYDCPDRINKSSIIVLVGLDTHIRQRWISLSTRRMRLPRRGLYSTMYVLPKLPQRLQTDGRSMKRREKVRVA